MLKKGKWRAFRNIPVGWVLHAIHGRDTPEAFFHITIELAVWTVCFTLMRELLIIDLPFLLLASFATSHTIMWILDGNLHIYMLDSFLWVKNPGIKKELKFIVWASELIKRRCTAKAILIYGSFCRGQFHDRSDLDLRVVAGRSLKDLLCLYSLAIWIRIISLTRGVPTDLQVVRDMDFLSTQMRSDEKPVVVYCQKGFNVDNRGLSFKKVLTDSSIVLKSDQP